MSAIATNGRLGGSGDRKVPRLKFFFLVLLYLVALGFAAVESRSSKASAAQTRSAQ